MDNSLLVFYWYTFSFLQTIITVPLLYSYSRSRQHKTTILGTNVTYPKNRNNNPLQSNRFILLLWALIRIMSSNVICVRSSSTWLSSSNNNSSREVWNSTESLTTLFTSGKLVPFSHFERFCLEIFSFSAKKCKATPLYISALNVYNRIPVCHFHW